MTEPLTIEVEEREGYVAVLLSGDLDLATSTPLKVRLQEELQNGRRRFLLDFSNVGHVDTTGLGMLVWLRNQLEGSGRLGLFGGSAHFRRIVQLTGLHALFVFLDDDQAIREHFSE